MSAGAVPIREVVDGIMDRGNLPARIFVKVSGGGAFFGDVFTWDASIKGYVCKDRPDLVANAEFVRNKWCKIFCSVPVIEGALV